VFAELMRAATRLTQSGRLAEATETIKRALRGAVGASPVPRRTNADARAADARTGVPATATPMIPSIADSAATVPPRRNARRSSIMIRARCALSPQALPALKEPDTWFEATSWSPDGRRLAGFQLRDGYANSVKQAAL
jgi:pyocin large subunit-like protein